MSYGDKPVDIGSPKPFPGMGLPTVGDVSMKLTVPAMVFRQLASTAEEMSVKYGRPVSVADILQRSAGMFVGMWNQSKTHSDEMKIVFGDEYELAVKFLKAE